MASKQSYPCFRCRDAGYDNVMVLLDGKDSEGKTKYLNEDGTRHQHKEKHQLQQQTQKQQMTGDEALSLKILNARIERIIKTQDTQYAMIEGLATGINRLIELLSSTKKEDNS